VLPIADEIEYAAPEDGVGDQLDFKVSVVAVLLETVRD
jgi:hypothetical protein